MKDIRREVERADRARLSRRRDRPAGRAGRRVAIVARRSRPISAAPRAPLGAARARQLVADYVALTKPKVQSLLLLTTITTMYVAGRPVARPRRC